MISLHPASLLLRPETPDRTRSPMERAREPKQVHGRPKKRLFLYGPAHRAQMLAETQGRRVLALGKVGAELYLAT